VDSSVKDVPGAIVSPPRGRYIGYSKNQRPEPDPEFMRVGPGKPCGEYLRRFWQPVCMTEELTKGVPVRIRILGEDLVAFRDLSGNYGLLHLHCSHRNTSLEFGFLAERGIKCCYHGWHYDVDGTILETPGEPAGSKIKERTCHGAYPVIEWHGLLFAYMGPANDVPPFPLYDTMNDLPGTELVPYKIVYPCNWLQVCENTMDPVHTVFLHSRLNRFQFEAAWQVMPLLEFHETPARVYATLTYRWKDMLWVRTQETTYPNFSQVGAFWEDAEEEKYFKRASITKWTVAIDDTHCMIIAYRSFGPGIDPHGKGKRELVGLQTVDFDGQTELRSYDVMQRDPSDYEAQVSIGPMATHGAENLGSTDRGVAILRRNIRNGIKAVQSGTPLPRLEPRDGEVATYVQDTVMPFRPRPAAEDEALMKALTAAVMDVVRRGDALSGAARREAIERGLADLKRDSRFSAG
jgi:phenylpropionate dioxygenase-like ring-hydroxylating dioxygenase large terminal subunit